MSKYPRTYHLPCSKGRSSDDKVLSEDNLGNFLGIPIVITEKLDGGNCAIINNNVYARSHAAPTSHPSFSMIKQILPTIQERLPDKELELFGENMQAIHSIDYQEIKSPFFLFGVRKKYIQTEKDLWLSWDKVEKIASQLRIPTAPVLFKGKIHSSNELKDIIEFQMSKPSKLNPKAHKEGLVIRIQDSFDTKDFKNCVAKYVRENHIQTNEHWSKNWTETKIRDNFIEQFYGFS